MPAATIEPLWPLRSPYQVACPSLTPARTCGLLSRPFEGCFEPERETVEVLNALLAGCGREEETCLYVDVVSREGFEVPAF